MVVAREPLARLATTIRRETSFMAMFRALPARRGIWYVAAAATAWGTGGAAAVVLYRTSGLGPVAVSFWRFVLAVALLAAARPVLRPGPFRGGRLRPVLGTGAGLALSQTAYFASVRFAGVAAGTVITIGAGPVLIALGARYALGERLGRRGAATVATALLGVGLLVGSGRGGGSAPLLGAGLALVSALGYSAVTVLRRAAGPVTPYDGALAGFAVGTCCLLPVALLSGLWPHTGAPLAFGLLVYLGAVPTALGYALFFAGLRTVRAATAAVVALLEAVTAAVVGVAALHERLGAPALAGGALLLGSVALMSTREVSVVDSPS
jgi:drug/metabolite transporter, DME family